MADNTYNPDKNRLNIADITEIDREEELNSPDSCGGELLYLRVGPEWAGERLDRFLAGKGAEVLPEASRSFWQKLLKEGQVVIPGREKALKANLLLAGGEELAVRLPAPELPEVLPEDIPLEVIYEDADVIVINKPRGMVVHPAAGNWSGTLVNALLWHCRDLSGINGVLRPGIVHRLDKETTGLMIAAKSDRAHRGLTEDWHEGGVNRYYLALLHGVMPEPGGVIDAPLGRSSADRKKMAVRPGDGRRAVTHYQVLERFMGKAQGFTLVRCKLETGRTHQIRVHMRYLGFPLVGDRVYGPKGGSAVTECGMLLHSAELDFAHPVSGERLSFTAPLPADFQEFMDKLKKQL